MTAINSKQPPCRGAAELFDEHQQQIFRRTDRLFAWLMLFQWLAGIVVARVVSPLTWAGSTSRLHPHVLTAIFLGGAISIPPIYLGFFHAGRTVTRYWIAVSQMLTSSLLIHLSGGRIETHFHVFGSLAFLAFYRDWRVLIPATIVVAADHILRGIYFPESVYGVIVASQWRWMEHAGWVIFEDIFLIASCVRGEKEMWQIAERTALADRRLAELEATRETLETAKEAAEAASRAKSDFLANMSHEIRTPLNGVIGMAHVLMRRQLNVQQMQCAKVIEGSAQSLLWLVNDILDFSKIEAGKLELHATDFDLEEAVESVIEMLSQKAAEKKLEFGCSIQPRANRRFRGDRERLTQILVNLVGNAIKFTERGEVFVEVDLLAEQADGATLRFTVRDTGAGIPADRRDRLFKSFSQVDSSMSRKYGGTGLGLAISRQLVELMGGQITCESEIGKGSVFYFNITLALCETPAPRRQATVGLQGMRILAVDDNAAYREILQNQLTSWGFDAVTAPHAEQAMIELRRARDAGRPFCMAILDFVLPGLNGMQLGAEIKADPTLRDTHLLMLTAMQQLIDAEEIKRTGITHCLTKPMRQSQMFDAIMETVLATDAKAAQPAAIPAGSPTSGRSRQAHLLLAEDNPVNQTVAFELLQDSGFTCDVANDGNAAVEAVQRQHYDLILMDCQMPGMNGFDATRKIRQLEADGVLRGPRRPIIALTANAIAGDRDRCLAAGMDDYISKPIDPDLMVEVIEKNLVRQKTESVPPIEIASLLKRYRGNQKLVDRLFSTFSLTIPEQLEALDRALSAANAEELVRLAHSIKGAAANLDAAEMRGAAKGVEKLAEAGELEAAGAEIQKLKDKVRECLGYIEQAKAPDGRGVGPLK
jgi:two-component system, sensor histidine kinase and response regulator